MAAVFHEITSVPQAPNGRVITVGNFDGFHRGHKAIIDRVVSDSAKGGHRPMIVTFDPHPRTVVQPQKRTRLLLTPDEELEALQKAFDGDVLVLKFDEKLRQMTAEDFVNQLLISTLGMQVLVSGENNTIGRDRQGDANYLTEHSRKNGYRFVVVPPVSDGHDLISSTAIRSWIDRGEIEKANAALCAPYRLSGTVIRGLGLGRKLGYPTANLAYHPDKTLPKEGIYATWVTVGDETFGGMLFVGRNYMDPERSFSVEANILNFDRDIYDQHVTYWPVAFIRDNREFTSKDALIRQIEEDKVNIEERLKSKKEYRSVC